MNEPAQDPARKGGGQTHESAKKNVEFFRDEYREYKANVESIDTYAAISSAVSAKLDGIQRLLDIGNGGVFDYDTTRVGEITGLDLFLDDLPADIRLPQNVTMVQGDALDLPAGLDGFDGVVMVMLIHHLVGRNIGDCVANVRQLLSGAHRALRPGGKLVIMESCVPRWFFNLEKLLFAPTALIIEKTMKHPPALQYPADMLEEMIGRAGFSEVERQNVPMGRYVLQYGVKVPTWVTPVQPVLFCAVRP
jgi:SAM-dependent methyltransferase